jgi:hypothetical protein
MKYILLIIICAGAYYGYTTKASPQIPASELTYIELLKRIKTEDVTANILFNAAHKSAADGCYDTQWLKIRGSNTQICNDKLKAFKDMCAERIFPDLNKVIVGYSNADKLLKRYSECTGV